MNFKQRKARSTNTSAYNLFNSTEKWGRRSQSIQARHSDEVEEDTVLEVKDETYKQVTDWITEFFGRQSLNSNFEDNDEEISLNIRQTMLLATLLPDELLGLSNLSTPQSERFVGVLLMADVSGYTALSEKYNSMGQSGTYRLTATLNGYIGSLVELIYNYGGDIIKFAGDAFLALFKTDKRTLLYHTIHNVICCALIIQHSYGDYETDVKVNLRVKLAISAGNLTFSTIGPSTDMNYVITGLPVLEAKQAEAACNSGEVTLSQTAWAHCYSRNYIYHVHNDGHVTINAILYDPRETDVSKPFPGIATLVRQVKNPHGSESYLNEMWKFTFTRAEFAKKRTAFSLRKNIVLAAERNIGKYARNFMIRPVLTQVDAHQPIDYLTEMRQVSILFLTFKPTECPINQLITIVDNAYTITCTIVYKSLGCVNKIILFDKDVMILVVFGLRGFKHESEAQAALKCACSIRKSIADLDGVLRASIGVTTGVVYCGVVGHPLRREFTVIGAIVNKAARLMCNFYNKVTCDEATFIKSKMSSNGFTLMPATSLKGIADPGKIYEYNEEIGIKEINDISVVQCLLDRTEEIDIFNKWIVNRNEIDALLIIGEARIGKSRLLQWFKRCSVIQGFKPCCIRLTSIHASTPYLALAQMMDKILNIPETSTSDFTKEENVVKLLGRCDQDLCYLNKIIKIRFAYHEAVYSTSQENRIKKAKSIFKEIIDSLEDQYLIVFDDLQNLDTASWDFVEVLLTSDKAAVVMSLNRVKLSSVHNWITKVLNNNRIRKVLIGPLSNQWTAPLACQILDVDAVPSDLCEALTMKCNGMPGIIENFLVHLYSSGALEKRIITEMELSEHEKDMLIFPKVNYIRPLALYPKDQNQLQQFFDESEEHKIIKICLVVDKQQLLENVGAQNFDAMLMMQIDTLTPYQQLLLKIASVIGNTLSRELLESIMYENDPFSSAKAIKKLFEVNILSCAHEKNKKTRVMNGTSKFVPSCECQFDYDEEVEILPKYSYCKVMKFRSKFSRKTCYELLPLNQKKEFHTRIVNYLVSRGKQKCVECGGNLTVVQSTVNINFRKLNIEGEGPQKSCQPNIIQKSNKTSSKPEITITKQSAADTLYTPASTSDDRYLRKRSAKRVTISEGPKYQSPIDECETIAPHDFRKIMDAKSLDDWHALGIKDSKDDLHPVHRISTRNKFYHIPIEKGISQTNFQRCTCAELNILIYEQLAYHSSKAELKIKAMNFLLLHCHFALRCNDHKAAIPKLEEAEELVQQIKHQLKRRELRQIIGRIHALKSFAFLLSGNILAAKLSVAQAADTYKARLHQISKAITVIENIQYRNKKHLSKDPLLKDTVFFYNVATLFYTYKGDDKTAKTSATRALDLVRRIECRVSDLLDSFSNALQVDVDRGSIDATIYTEKLIRHTVKKFELPLGTDELQSIGKLYVTTFRAQLCRGDLVSAIRTGYRASTLSLFLNCEVIFFDVAPELFYSLLSRARIQECVALLQVILRLKHTVADKRVEIFQESDTWYYALCMDVILDGGFQIESPYEINRYGEEIINKGSWATDSSKYRLFTNLWVYWLRISSDNSKIFEQKVLDWFEDKAVDESLSGLVTLLRYVEGMLESFSKKMDDLKKVVYIMELRSQAERELGRMERDVELMRALYPRWLLLKAHCMNICGHKNSAMQKFLQAHEHAKIIHNKMEIATAKCVNTAPPNYWVHSALVGNFIDWRHITDHINYNWEIFMYNITTANVSLVPKNAVVK